MSAHERYGYRIGVGRITMAVLVFALVFVIARLVIDDSLTLGYAMVVPAYVLISAAIESARPQRSSFWDIRGWVETSVATAGAVGVGYLGFSLWSIGY